MSVHPGIRHHFQRQVPKSLPKVWGGPERRLQSNPSHPHPGPRVLGPEECPPPVWCLARSDPPLAPPQPSPQSAPSSQLSQPRVAMFWLDENLQSVMTKISWQKKYPCGFRVAQLPSCARQLLPLTTRIVNKKYPYIYVTYVNYIYAMYMIYNDIQWYIYIYSDIHCTDIQWYTMIYNDIHIQWYTMIYNDMQWYTMIYNDIQWSTMIYNDMQWYTMISNDIQWYTMIYNDIQWSTMIYNDIQWYTMIYNDIQWYTCIYAMNCYDIREQIQKDVQNRINIWIVYSTLRRARPDYLTKLKNISWDGPLKS